jgi:hypothetical protein
MRLRSDRGRSGRSSGASPDPLGRSLEPPLRRSDGHRARSSGVTQWEGLRNDCGQSAGDEFRSWSESVPTPINRTRKDDMTATYTFDVFPASTATAPPAPTGPATGARKDPSCSTTALPCTARSSGWSSGRTRIGHSPGCWPRAPRSPTCGTWVTRMRSLPATVVSTTLEGPLDWPDATVGRGDAVDVVARLRRSPRCRCARTAACG